MYYGDRQFSYITNIVIFRILKIKFIKKSFKKPWVTTVRVFRRPVAPDRCRRRYRHRSFRLEVRTFSSPRAGLDDSRQGLRRLCMSEDAGGWRCNRCRTRDLHNNNNVREHLCKFFSEWLTSRCRNSDLLNSFCIVAGILGSQREEKIADW